jgi:phosphoglycerate dehydrogenase-like enzyme
MTAPQILILMKPTPGDSRFYERWQEVGEITQRPDQATVLLTDHRNPVTEDLLGSLPRLKYVVSPNTAHTHLRFDPEARDIEIISLKGETGFLSEVRSVAEFTMGLILRLARPLEDSIGTLLNNKMLGVVGYGRIGKQLSIIASAFGMRVCHVDKESPDWSWKLLFQRSDFVSIHLPECPETLGLIGKDLLSQMKPTSFLVNTARPSVLDEMALSQLLAEEKIRGAALDVTDMNWIHFPQVITAPHVAGFTLEDRVKTDEFVLEKLKQRLGKRRVREAH